MKRKADQDPLLDDVFGEATPAGLREAMLGESLRVVRRRRTGRRLGRATAALIAVVLTVVLVRQSAQRPPMASSRPAPAIVEKSYKLVQNQSLPASALVTTRPFSTAQSAGAMMAVRIVRTRPDGFRAINDEQLLSLISPRPCALIQVGPRSEKLVFLNPDDAKGFRVN